MNSSLNVEHALWKQGPCYMHTPTVKAVCQVYHLLWAATKICAAPTPQGWDQMLSNSFLPPQTGLFSSCPSSLSYSLPSCALRTVIQCPIHHHSTTEVSSPPTGPQKKVKKQFYQIFTCHLSSYIENGLTLQSFILRIHHHKTPETPDTVAGCYNLETSKTNRRFSGS